MPKIAIAHEWVDSRAGSEKTFEALAEAFPSADLYSLSVTPGVHLETGGRVVTTSLLDTPTLRDRRQLTLPIMPAAWNQITRSRYDLVISSSHAFARWFRPAREAYHLSYVHAPMRYVWTPELDTRSQRYSSLIRAASGPLKLADRASLRWTERLIANSTEVQGRIRRYYSREASVIHPPVDVAFYSGLPIVPPSSREDYLLAYSRFIPYKRLDLAIHAAASNKVRLVIAGRGPEESNLRKLARHLEARVDFRIGPSDEELRQLARKSRGVIFGAFEDFGLVPVEAQSAGAPVVALARGGTLDTVLPGITGVLAGAQTPDEFSRAVTTLLDTPFDAESIRAHAMNFSVANFKQRVTEAVREAGFSP